MLSNPAKMPPQRAPPPKPSPSHRRHVLLRRHGGVLRRLGAPRGADRGRPHGGARAPATAPAPSQERRAGAAGGRRRRARRRLLRAQVPAGGPRRRGGARPALAQPARAHLPVGLGVEARARVPLRGDRRRGTGTGTGTRAAARAGGAPRRHGGRRAGGGPAGGGRAGVAGGPAGAGRAAQAEAAPAAERRGRGGRRALAARGAGRGRRAKGPHAAWRRRAARAGPGRRGRRGHAQVPPRRPPRGPRLDLRPAARLVACQHRTVPPMHHNRTGLVLFTLRAWAPKPVSVCVHPTNVGNKRGVKSSGYVYFYHVIVMSCEQKLFVELSLTSPGSRSSTLSVMVVVCEVCSVSGRVNVENPLTSCRHAAGVIASLFALLPMQAALPRRTKYSPFWTRLGLLTGVFAAGDWEISNEITSVKI
ncbi:hypothetical protein BDA96_03G153200 [Sorghum bicolor]|uniref:Uncharacterized protein n=1 Tax=Sorghum bicolor TaxID=4558 RepID=A0A921UMB6_SORBI|nr:hypothetical protein BDA96_03G153200 [Sorghum bicolor]